MTIDRQQIIENYIPLARSIGKKRCPEGRDADDTISAALEALVYAVSKLSNDGVGVSSFLIKKIDGAVRNFVTRELCAPPVSGVTTSRYGRQLIGKRHLFLDMQHSEIIEALDIPKKYEMVVPAAIPAVARFDSYNVDEAGVESIRDEEHANPEEHLIEKEQRYEIIEDMQEWIGNLPEFEQKYVREVMLPTDDKITQEEFSKRHDVPVHRLQHISKKIREDMQEELSYLWERRK